MLTFEAEKNIEQSKMIEIHEDAKSLRGLGDLLIDLLSRS